MDTFFRTPELVGLVMQGVMANKSIRTGPEPIHVKRDEDEHVKSRKTLAACSRVNRLISHEALRILWRSLDDVLFLLHLLPPDAVIEVDGYKQTSRPLVSSDWNRFLLYAPLVRQIIAEEDPVLMKPFFLYSKLFPGKALLPNLATLEWIGPFHSETFALLIVPCLRRICIENPYAITPEKETAKMDACLAQTPSLESLEIIWQEDSGGIGLRRSLLSSSSLKSLTLSRVPIVIEELLILRGLPTLETLRCSVDSLPQTHSSVELGEYQSTVAPGFPALRSLTMEGSIENSIYFFHYLGVNPREALSVYITDFEDASPPAFANLVACMGTILSPMLQALEIHPLDSPAWDETREDDCRALPLTNLSPLKKFQELRVLWLHLPYAIDLCDDDIPSFCNGFSKIEKLALSCEPCYGGYKSKLTPACLRWFANSKPQLRTLGLYLEPQWIRYMDCSWPPQTNSCLETLFVGYSRLERNSDDTYKEGDASLLLGDLFPLLKWAAR
ncbi:hypothetical protein FRC02_001319 [Tulasnella sp. 418]|nr:hypothetical protein FRC02_001319 [Tulasnella sp. 418]